MPEGPHQIHSPSFKAKHKEYETRMQDLLVRQGMDLSRVDLETVQTALEMLLHTVKTIRGDGVDAVPAYKLKISRARNAIMGDLFFLMEGIVLACLSMLEDPPN